MNFCNLYVDAYSENTLLSLWESALFSVVLA